MTKRTNQSDLEKLLSAKGVVSSKDLLPILGHRVAIKQQADGGAIVPLGSGYYHGPGVDPLTAAIATVGRYYKKAIISKLSALHIHGLTDEAIGKVDVDIDKATDLKNKLLNVHRIKKEKLIGSTKASYQGFEITVYDPERSLCEAYLIDPGGAIFFKALKRYMERFIPNPNLIQKYDQVLKTKVLLHLTQELADA